MSKKNFKASCFLGKTWCLEIKNLTKKERKKKYYLENKIFFRKTGLPAKPDYPKLIKISEIFTDYIKIAIGKIKGNREKLIKLNEFSGLKHWSSI